MLPLVLAGGMHLSVLPWSNHELMTPPQGNAQAFTLIILRYSYVASLLSAFNLSKSVDKDENIIDVPGKFQQRAGLYRYRMRRRKGKVDTHFHSSSYRLYSQVKVTTIHRTALSHKSDYMIYKRPSVRARKDWAYETVYLQAI